MAPLRGNREPQLRESVDNVSRSCTGGAHCASVAKARERLSTIAQPGIGVRATASPGPARDCETFPHPIPKASEKTGRRGPGIVVPGRGVHSLPAPCEPGSHRFVSLSPTNGEPESHHS